MTSNPLDLKTPAQAQARRARERLRAREPRPHEPALRLLEPARRGALRGDRRSAARAGSSAAARSSSTPASTPRARRRTSSSSASRRPRIRSGGASTTARSATDKFEEILGRMLGFLQGRDLFVQDLDACAQPEYRLPIRIVTEHAWHSLFARNMFLTPANREAYRQHVPEFTIVCAPSFKAYEPIDGTRTRHVHRARLRAAALPDRRHRVRGRAEEVRVHGAQLPAPARRRPEHALLGERRPTTATPRSSSGSPAPARRRSRPTRGAGSSATTSTAGATRASSTTRTAATRRRSGSRPTAEPQIHATTHRFGTVLENVVFDEVTRRIDLDDDTLTENTRASYPLDFIEQRRAVADGRPPELRPASSRATRRASCRRSRG